MIARVIARVKDSKRAGESHPRFSLHQCIFTARLEGQSGLHVTFNMRLPILSSALLIGAALAASAPDPAADALAQFQQLTAEAQAAQVDLLSTAEPSSKRANTCTKNKLIVRKPWYVTRLASPAAPMAFHLAVSSRVS